MNNKREIMKKIYIDNGEVRNGYEFDDLSVQAQEKVISDQIDFEIDIMTEDSPYYGCVVEMQKSQTPWFLRETIYHKHKVRIIYTIKMNNYLFDEDGEILPIEYCYKENKVYKIVYRTKLNHYDCKIAVDPKDITDSHDACLYCLNVKDDPKVREHITDSNDAYVYCRDVKDDPEIRKYITDSDDAYWYCRYIKDDPKVRKYITDSRYAYWYCVEVEDRPEIRKLIK
jgi:hypothetical protein